MAEAISRAEDPAWISTETATPGSTLSDCPPATAEARNLAPRASRTIATMTPPAMNRGFLKRPSVVVAAGSVTREVLAIEKALEDHRCGHFVPDVATLRAPHSSFEQRCFGSHRCEPLILVHHGKAGSFSDDISERSSGYRRRSFDP